MDQQVFLARCREKAEGKNFAPQLADLLGLNLDAAYRRIRGSTSLTYLEIQKICRHYDVSFDTAVNYQGKSHSFEFTSMFDADGFDMLTYVRSVLKQLKIFRQDPNCSLTLVSMDLPYFRQFGYSSLQRFKLFYWQRAVLNLEAHRHSKFNPKLCNEAMEEVMKEMYTLYHEFDSIEIWAPETLDSTLKQVQYGMDSGLFNSGEDALLVCDDLDNLLNKLQHEAVEARKTLNAGLNISGGNFGIYQSDILLGSNTVQVQCDRDLYTYIGFNSFNSLMSRSPRFSAECRRWISQVKTKSNLLSDGSEKLRYKFFNHLRNKITKLRKGIEEMSVVD